jgi:hypothetical protein
MLVNATPERHFLAPVRVSRHYRKLVQRFRLQSSGREKGYRDKKAYVVIFHSNLGGASIAPIDLIKAAKFHRDGLKRGFVWQWRENGNGSFALSPLGPFT